jgi:hypothetical protein
MQKIICQNLNSILPSLLGRFWPFVGLLLYFFLNRIIHICIFKQVPKYLATGLTRPSGTNSPPAEASTQGLKCKTNTIINKLYDKTKACVFTEFWCKLWHSVHVLLDWNWTWPILGQGQCHINLPFYPIPNQEKQSQQRKGNEEGLGRTCLLKCIPWNFAIDGKNNITTSKWYHEYFLNYSLHFSTYDHIISVKTVKQLY